MTYNEDRTEVTMRVFNHENEEYALLYFCENGDVVGIKLPSTPSPNTEPDAWNVIRVKLQENGE